MTVSGSCLNDRNRAVFHDSADQSGTAARNQNIDIAVHLHKLRRRLAGGIFDQKQGVFRHLLLFQCFPKRGNNRRIRVDCIASAF